MIRVWHFESYLHLHCWHHHVLFPPIFYFLAVLGLGCSEWRLLFPVVLMLLIAMAFLSLSLSLFFLWHVFYFIFFNWRIIALQNFVASSQTSTRISHRDTSVPLPPHPTLPDCHRAPVSVPLYYVWCCKFPRYSLHSSHPLPPPHPRVHPSVLYVRFSIVDSGFSCHRAQAPGTWASVGVACGLSCGIFPDREWSLCPLHW